MIFSMLATALVTPFAGVAVLDAVAQFPGLVLAGACAAGDGGAPDCAAGEFDVGLDGGIAAGIKNLPGANVCDDGE